MVVPALRELEVDQLLRQTTEARVIIARKEPYPPSVRASTITTYPAIKPILSPQNANLDRTQVKSGLVPNPLLYASLNRAQAGSGTVPSHSPQVQLKESG